MFVRHDSSPVGNFLVQRSVPFVPQAVMTITSKRAVAGARIRVTVQKNSEEHRPALIARVPTYNSAFHFRTNSSSCDSNHRPASQVPASFLHCFSLVLVIR